MKVFVPQSCAVIDKLSKDWTGKDLKIDEELKFNILILSEVRIDFNRLVLFLESLYVILKTLFKLILQLHNIIS